jgi:hypothetical protein
MAVLVPKSLLKEFTKDQKQLVKDLSRSIIIGMGSLLEEDCPNCFYDIITKSSTGEYSGFTGSKTLFAGTAYERIVNAIPFTKSICPVCKNVGKFSVPNEKSILANYHWETPDGDSLPITPVGQEGQHALIIKTDSKYYADFVNAKYFVVDGVRVEPSSIPIVRVMANKTTGIVEIICRTVETGRETVR